MGLQSGSHENFIFLMVLRDNSIETVLQKKIKVLYILNYTINSEFKNKII